MHRRAPVRGRFGGRFGRHVWAKRAALAFVPLLAGCSGPLSTLDPAGPAAAAIAWLWWVMLAGAAVLTVLVLVLVWLGFRPPAARQPAPRVWTHGLGLWFPLAVLSLLLAAGLWTGERLLPRPGADVVRVEAHAEQWRWTFRQPGPEGAAVETEGTLHIPAGRPVDVAITAGDVIHSFWVPQLGGKMDAIPGRVNLLRIEADRPGIYEGLCAEFCGLGHTEMRLRVVAYPPGEPPDFAAGDAP